ncbi:MAG: Ulp1 family isopeptidase [Saprospiraceae bacterium]
MIKEEYCWASEYTAGAQKTADTIVENYLKDDHKRSTRFFAQNHKGSSGRGIPKENKQMSNWFVKDKILIEDLKEKRDKLYENLKDFREAKNWLKSKELFCKTSRKGNISGYSEKKCTKLKQKGIQSIQDFAFIENANASVYLGSKDRTKGRTGQLRCDEAFEKKIKEVREKLVSEKGLSNWEEYKRVHHQKTILVENQENQPKLISEASKITESNKPEKTYEDTLDIGVKDLVYSEIKFTFCSKTVDLICDKIFSKIGPFFKQILSITPPTNFWKVDNTFKICKRLTMAHPSCKDKRINPFKSLLTITNAYGQYLGLHMNFGEGNMVEIEPYLRNLLQRCRNLLGDPGYVPAVIVVDDCCKVRYQYQNALGKKVLVKLDVFHWLDRWSKCLAVPLGHPRRREFFQMMADAVLCPDNDQFIQLTEKSGIETEWMDTDLHHIFSKRCLRRPRPHEEMKVAVTKVVNYFLSEIDANVKTARTRKNLLEALKADCDSCRSLATTISKCSRCTWGQCQLTFKYGSGKTNVFNIIKNQMEHIEKDCLSYPPHLNLHHQNSKGKIFKLDSTCHNENEHLQLMKPFKGGTYGPLKMQRYLLRRAVDANKNAAIKRDLEFPMSRPDEILLNSAASRFSDDPEQLPFNKISPFTRSDFPLGVEVISPVEDIDLSFKVAKTRKLNQAIKRAIIGDSENDNSKCDLLQAIVVGLRLSNIKVTIADLQKLKADDEISTFEKIGCEIGVNISVLNVEGGIPSETAQVKYCSADNKAMVFLLKNENSYRALQSELIQQALYSEPTDIEMTSTANKARNLCVKMCALSAPFQMLQESSRSMLPLPAPFIFNAVQSDESLLFDKLAIEFKLTNPKPSQSFWGRFSLKWNEVVEKNIMSKLCDKSFKFKNLYTKTWNQLRDFYKHKQEKLPKLLPGDSLGISDSEGFKEARKALQTHANHLSPTKPRDKSLPAAVPESFPRLALNYQRTQPGTQLPGMPKLANPNISINKLAPYAPIEPESNAKSAQIKRAKPGRWINMKKICSKCYFPYGKLNGHSTHGFLFKKRKCLNSLKENLDEYAGSEYDKRVTPQQPYQSKKRKLEDCFGTEEVGNSPSQLEPPVMTEESVMSVAKSCCFPRLETTRFPLQQLPNFELNFRFTVTEESLFRRACSIEDMKVIFNRQNVPLTRKTLVKPFGFLQNGMWTGPEWLNDEIINLWMIKLKLECAADGRPNLYFSTFFYVRLMERNVLTYKNVMRWVKEDIFSYEKIFVPVNWANTHWFLCVIYLQQGHICVYDSIPLEHQFSISLEERTMVCQNLLNYLELHASQMKQHDFMKSKTWKFEIAPKLLTS